MIAGYQAGEVDFATDLQASPTSRRSRTSATRSRRSRPSSTSSSGRTGPTARPWARTASATAPATRPSPDRGTAARCPTRRCARRSPSRSTRTRSTTALLGGNAQVANTQHHAPAWFYVGADRRRRSIPSKAKQILEDAGWVDSDGDGVREKDGLQAKIELCTTPARSASTRSPSSPTGSRTLASRPCPTR